MAVNFNSETVTERFRVAVLAALDEAAIETFGELPLYQHVARQGSGAYDADLPRLFAAIDAQVEVLVDRYDVKLVDVA